jgi:hypothetical protein
VRGASTRIVFTFVLLTAGCGGGGGSASSVPQASVATAALSSVNGVIALSSVGDTVTGTIPAGTASDTIAALSTAEVASLNPLPLESMGITLGAGTAQGHVIAPLGALTAATGAVQAPFGAQTTPPVERYPAEDDVTIQAALSHLVRSSALQAANRGTQSLPTTVGATTSFWIQAATLGSPSGPYAQLGATLAAVTAHGYIWIDDSLTALLSSSAAVGAIAADFENAYASDTAHFGGTDYSTAAAGYAAYASVGACDASGNPTGASTPAYIADTDPHIVVFVVNVQSLGAGVGGYFTAANFWTTGAANCTVNSSNPVRTNTAPMIYVGYQPSLPPGYPANYELAEDLVRSTAHELQHLINFVNHVLIANGPQEDRWINEGLSMLAQDLAVARMYGISNDVDDAVTHAAHYLAAPQNYSITGFSGVDAVSQGGTGALQYNCPNCYGAEYLFQRYLYDRFGGDAYTHKVELTGTSSYANLTAATGTGVPTLLADFGVALAASNTGLTSDPSYTFTGLDLESTLKDQFGGTLTLTGPHAATSVSSGANDTVGEYLGTYLYLSVSGAGTGGETITISDPAGAFGLNGAIIEH